MSGDRQMSLNKLFTSKVGTDILSQCVEQFASTRFQILRDLYLLQTAAVHLSTQVGIALTSFFLGMLRRQLKAAVGVFVSQSCGITSCEICEILQYIFHFFARF